MKTSYLPPKIHQLENAKKGQSFRHNLRTKRNWTEAMDALHTLFSSYPFYAAVVTNTVPTFLGSKILKRKLNLRRSKKNIPKELKDILSVKSNTFYELKNKIRVKSIHDEGGERDVWHFTSKWKEFPKGSKIIELYQEKRATLFSTSGGYRRAFVVLDARCNVAELNKVMFNIKKVFEDKAYTKRILRGSKKTKRSMRNRKVDIQLKFETTEKRHRSKKRDEMERGRGPATLFLQLQENFNFQVRTVTLEEKATLYAYFENLKNRGESRREHEEMERRVTSYFISKAKRKGNT